MGGRVVSQLEYEAYVELANAAANDADKALVAAVLAVADRLDRLGAMTARLGNIIDAIDERRDLGITRRD